MVVRRTPSGQGIDTLSHGGIVISTVHAWVHEGQAFEAGHLWSEASAIADNANADLLLQLTGGAHLIFNYAAGGDAEVSFYLNPTWSNAGTSLSVFNKNHYSPSTSDMAVSYNPTITDVGTLYPAFMLPGGTGGNASGSSETFDRERILKGGNNYLIRLTNRAGVIKAASIGIDYYEPN